MTRRILYVTDTLMPGGIESQLVELVTRLDRTRFDPHVLCLYGPATRPLHFAPALRDAGIPVETLDLGWGARDKLAAVGRIARHVRYLRPQIVQAEGYHANLLTRLSRPLLPPVRLIGTVRGIESPKQRLYERLSHWLCARMVASGPHLKADLVRGGVPAQRIEVIANAIDTQRFAAPSDPTLRQRLAPDVTDAGRVFVSLGRISRQKSMHLIAQALGQLAAAGRLPGDVRVFIVGPTEDPAMRTALEQAIHADGLERQVIQHPATRTPEDYYHASDASILFTTLEGISCAMLESLAAGRPVVISEEANGAGVIEHGVTGWVVRTHDVAHLAETLAHVIALPQADLARMRAACVRRAAQYDVRALVAAYEDLYAAL